MKQENIELKVKIVHFLKQNNIEIKNIEFYPLGEESLGYKVTSSNGLTLFVKYCKNPQIIVNILQVHKFLQRNKELDFIVPPYEFGGLTEIKFEDGLIYAYPYIQGNVVLEGNEQFNESLVEKLTGIMTKIHSTPHRNNELPFEKFDYNFLYRLTKLISQNTIDEIEKIVGIKISILKNLLHHFSEELINIKSRNLGMVITHGDITGRNIILSEESIKLVDWDGMMIAPLERDINFLSDNQFFSVENYQKIIGKTIDKNICDFYGKVWSLESIIENLERLFEYKPEYGDKEDMIQEIHEYLNYYV